MTPAPARAATMLHAARRDVERRYQYYAHVAGILLDSRAHRQLGQLLSGPELGGLLETRPDLRRKYLWPCLARQLSRRQRLEIVLAHFGFLAGRLDPALATRMLRRPEPLWEHRAGNDRYTISLGYLRRMWDLEGELGLVYESNGTPLYTLSFTFAKGATFGRRERDLVLVGGVQGNIGRLDLIRASTRACGDVAPRTTLLAALSGLALAAGVEAILGVTNVGHITRYRTAPDEFRFDYDHFWSEMGGRLESGFFALEVPLREKPIGLVAATHRRRAMRRRALREGVTAQARARAAETIVRAGSAIAP